MLHHITVAHPNIGCVRCMLIGIPLCTMLLASTSFAQEVGATERPYYSSVPYLRAEPKRDL